MVHLPDFILDKKLIDEESSGKYGDLYYLCMLDDFRISLPEYYPTFANSEKLKSLDSADIIVLGDSFFRMTRVEKNFIQFLNDSLKMNVFFRQEFNVYNVLKDNNYKKGKSKILLYEIVERHILDNFTYKQVKKGNVKRGLTDAFSIIVPYDREIYYQYVLQKSILTSKIYGIVSNLRFSWFKEITDVVPIYSVNPPWLFLYKDVDKKFTSFYNNYSDEKIDNVAENIRQLSDELKRDFDIDFIFFPVPNKYSLYSDKINNDKYNMFLPRLYAALDKKGVKNIKIYNEFKNSEEILYYPTDTHWNPEGNRLVLKLFIEQMRKYNYLF
jgi:hypothetical protein